MDNNLKYDSAYNATLEYKESSRKVLNQLKVIEGWKQLSLSYEGLYKDTSYFLYGLNKFKSSPTVEKYLFIDCYSSFFKWGFLSLDTHRMSSLESKLYFPVDLYEIFGPNLITSNAQHISLKSSFDPKDYANVSLHPNSVVAFEFAPIIDAWFDMWIEFQEEWKNDFNEKYLSYDLLNTLRPALPAYQKFCDKRLLIVDQLYKTGRITTKGPAEYT